MLRLVLVFSCFMILEAPCHAQARSEDPRTTSARHVGPLYLTPAFAVSEFGLDTNVFNSAGEREKDFTFTIVPRLLTALPFARRGLLKLSTAADLVYYQKHQSERSINPNIALRGEIY